jgi:hypothetical protein
MNNPIKIKINIKKIGKMEKIKKNLKNENNL